MDAVYVQLNLGMAMIIGPPNKPFPALPIIAYQYCIECVSGDGVLKRLGVNLILWVKSAHAACFNTALSAFTLPQARA